MSDRDPNQDFSHAIRPCRGHWHVVVLDADGTSTDLAIEGDPFTSEKSAQRAAERLNRGENIPGLLPAWPAASAVVETPALVDPWLECDACHDKQPLSGSIRLGEVCPCSLGSYRLTRPAVVETPAEAPTAWGIRRKINGTWAWIHDGAVEIDKLRDAYSDDAFVIEPLFAAVAGPRVPEGGGTDASQACESVIDAHEAMMPELQADVKATWEEVLKRLRYLAVEASDEERRENWSNVLGAMHINNTARNRVYMARWFTERDGLRAELSRLRAEIDARSEDTRLLRASAEERGDLAEVAWGLIANVSGSDWTRQTDEWQVAAVRWRGLYHKMLGLRAPIREAGE